MTKRTVLIFRGPQHHAPLLKPLENELRRRGWRVEHFTTNTEANFQIALNRELGIGNYYWLGDYIVRDKAERLYLEHAGKFQERLEEKNVLSMMMPVVLDRIVKHTCEEWTAIPQLLKAVKPDRVLALHEINRWGVILGYWCQQRKIPYFTMQEGLYYGDPWIYTGHTTYGTSLVWGQGTKDKLIAAGCPAEKIVVAGHPDLLQRIQAGQARVEGGLGEGWDWRKNRKVIMVLPALSHVDRNAELLVQGLEKDWCVVIRPHPLSGLQDVTDLQTIFAPYSDQVKVLPVDVGEEEKWEWLMASGVCLVAGTSSVMLEVLAAEKPLGLIEAHGMVRRYADEGLGSECTGLTLQDAAKKILLEKEKFADNQRAWVKKEAERLDAAGVMADIVEAGTWTIS